jgi:hypothetical protein
MKPLLRNTLLAAALSLGLSFAGVVSAQECDPKDPKCEEPPPPPKTGDCSPGYWKNHLTEWVGIYCDTGAYPVSCAVVLAALTCKGSDASCGRSLAAAYLNALTGCTE